MSINPGAEGYQYSAEEFPYDRDEKAPPACGYGGREQGLSHHELGLFLGTELGV